MLLRTCVTLFCLLCYISYHFAYILNTFSHLILLFTSQICRFCSHRFFLVTPSSLWVNLAVPIQSLLWKKAFIISTGCLLESALGFCQIEFMMSFRELKLKSLCFFVQVQRENCTSKSLSPIRMSRTTL